MEKLFLTVGNAEIDLTCRLSKIPLVHETTVETGNRELSPGGDGLLTACALAALGSGARLCAPIGRDRYGELLTRFCRERGIGTEYLIPYADEETAFRLRLTESSGVSRAAFYPGAFSSFKAPYVEDAFRCRPDAVCASLDLTAELIARISDEADEQDVPLFLDAADAPSAYPLDRIGTCEFFSASAEEVYRFTKILPDSMDSCLKASVRLAGLVNARYYAIRLKERGVFLYDGKYFSLIVPQRQDDFDSPAARQVFLAAVAYAYLTEREIETACRYAAVAVAVSALKTEGPAAERIPTRAEITAYCEKYHIG
ncbi:MAG: carbohydrate kinase family protein [Eubacteriales bacterium]|nr:carbohydrate kinase family protein [Eubacteriales bacterium]